MSTSGLWDSGDAESDVVDHRVPIDARALDWLRARLWAAFASPEFRAALVKSDPEKQFDHVRAFLRDDESDTHHERAVEYLVAHPPSCLTWVPADAYRGPSYVAGAWQFQFDIFIVSGVVYQLEQADARAADAQTIATLDDWLAADQHGTIRTEVLDTGWDLMRTVSDDERHAMLKRQTEGAQRRQASWFRACVRCGESFRPATPKNGFSNARITKTCKPCCDKRRRRA